MDEQKQLRNGIVEGTIWKEILKFFFPIMLGTLFQQLYNTVDTVVVGQFEGSAAVAAVGGSSAQILNLIIGFFVGVSSGATVIVSQYFGRRDEKGVSDAVHTGLALAIVGLDEYAQGHDDGLDDVSENRVPVDDSVDGL